MGRASGGGGRRSAVVASGRFFRLAGSSNSTAYDTGGARLVAGFAKNPVSELRKFPISALKKARSGIKRDIEAGTTWPHTPRQAKANLGYIEKALRGAK